MMQLNMETSIQARDIEDIMVTTTLDLVFTFLDISFIIL